jgi:hypothetical protein
MQCDYLFGFQIERRISKSFLLQNWLINAFDIKDDEDETPILTYSKELDSLVSASCITKSLEEEENSPPHIKKIVVIDSTKEIENILPAFQGYATMNSKDMTLAPT